VYFFSKKNREEDIAAMRRGRGTRALGSEGVDNGY
jgi:hypothetical protein